MKRNKWLLIALTLTACLLLAGCGGAAAAPAASPAAEPTAAPTPEPRDPLKAGVYPMTELNGESAEEVIRRDETDKKHVEYVLLLTDDGRGLLYRGMALSAVEWESNALTIQGYDVDYRSQGDTISFQYGEYDMIFVRSGEAEPLSVRPELAGEYADEQGNTLTLDWTGEARCTAGERGLAGTWGRDPYFDNDYVVLDSLLHILRPDGESLIFRLDGEQLTVKQAASYGDQFPTLPEGSYRLETDDGARLYFYSDKVGLLTGNAPAGLVSRFGRLYSNGEVIPFTLDGDRVTLEYGGNTLVYVRESDTAPDPLSEETLTRCGTYNGMGGQSRLGFNVVTGAVSLTIRENGTAEFATPSDSKEIFWREDPLSGDIFLFSDEMFYPVTFETNGKGPGNMRMKLRISRDEVMTFAEKIE